MGTELQTIFNAVFGLIAILVGWVLNTVWQAVKGLQSDDKEITRRIAAIEVLVAGEYVKRDDYRADLKDLQETLLRIEQKLDGKVDKT